MNVFNDQFSSYCSCVHHGHFSLVHLRPKFNKKILLHSSKKLNILKAFSEHLWQIILWDTYFNMFSSTWKLNENTDCYSNAQYLRLKITSEDLFYCILTIFETQSVPCHVVIWVGDQQQICQQLLQTGFMNLRWGHFHHSPGELPVFWPENTH